MMASYGSNTRRVVGYFSSWANYRQGLGKYTVDDIPVELCTHLIYAFAVLDNDSLLAKPHDQYLDVDCSNYKKFVNLKKKNRNLKVLLGLGGWNDSQGSKYSNLVADSSRRSRFVNHVVKLLRDHGFDGLDLDYEYPRAEDREGFSLWVKELKAAMSPYGLLLTAAVSANQSVIDSGYNIPRIMMHLDFVNVMAYDFYGSWNREVAHHAPLSAVKEQIKYWIKGGAPANKVVLGVPFYGVSWTLAGPSNNPGSPAVGSGRAGRYTNEGGRLAYYECLELERDGWRKRDSDEGHYLTRGDQWIGYDDTSDVSRKAQYAREKGLGGIMVWDLSYDDFRNISGRGSNPLLRAIHNSL